MSHAEGAFWTFSVNLHLVLIWTYVYTSNRRRSTSTSYVCGTGDRSSSFVARKGNEKISSFRSTTFSFFFFSISSLFALTIGYKAFHRATVGFSYLAVYLQIRSNDLHLRRVRDRSLRSFVRILARIDNRRRKREKKCPPVRRGHAKMNRSHSCVIGCNHEVSISE